MNTPLYPPEVAVTVLDLLQFEWLAGKLPNHFEKPVYSLLAGRHPSKLRGRGMDFDEVRQYIPGDDIRSIDWHVTARTGVPQSKLYNEEKERPVFIVLDQRRNMFFGSTRYMKSVTAAHLAAAAAFYTVRRGDRVGGLIFSDDDQIIIPPRRSRDTLRFLLEMIAKMNNLLPLKKPGRLRPVREMVDLLASRSPHDQVILFIGDCMSLDREAIEGIKQLALHNDIMINHIYDPFDEQLPDGKLILTDGQYQLRWDNRRHGNGRLWKEAFRKEKEKFTGEFKNTRIPVSFFNTSEPVKLQLKQALWTRPTIRSSNHNG